MCVGKETCLDPLLPLSMPSVVNVTPLSRQDPLPLAHPLLRRLRSDPSSQLLGSQVTKPGTPEPRAMETQLEQLQG